MVRKNVAEILTNHVTFELEAIDRMYLNAYVPSLQTGGGVRLLREDPARGAGPVDHDGRADEPAVRRGHRAVRRDGGHRSGDLREGPTEGRRRAGVPRRRSRARRACSSSARPRRRPASSAPRSGATRRGKTYPWIIRSTAMVNHYYVYILDRDFGPLFIKFCSYFPYPAKLCLNGHEWLKRQLTQREVAVRAAWTTASAPARPPPACSGSPTRSTPPRSTRSSANGSAACRIPSRPPTAPPAIGISSRSCKPSSP